MLYNAEKIDNNSFEKQIILCKITFCRKIMKKIKKSLVMTKKVCYNITVKSISSEGNMMNDSLYAELSEIGRASCRERVCLSV